MSGENIEEKEIAEKFSLPDIKEKILCFNHKDHQAVLQCPICQRFFCRKCFKLIQKIGKPARGVCKICYKRLILRGTILYLLFFYLILRLFFDLYP